MKLEIVALPLVNAMEIVCSAADRPVRAQRFPSDKFLKLTVERDEEDIEGLQHHRQLRRPTGLLENVFQQEIVAGRGIGDQGAVEPFEETGTVFLPPEVAAPESFRRQRSRITNMVNRDVPEWLADLCLDRARQSGFSTAGSAVNEDNLGSFDHI